MFYENKIRICFVGNPNVGKSTLINRILKSNKLKTSDIPGTTKEITETVFVWKKKKYVLIDTAGVYKKKNVNYKLLINAIRSSDIVILILESTIERLDKLNKKLSDYSLKVGRGLIIVFNKYDLIKEKKNMKKKLKNLIKHSLFQVDLNKILFISALRDTNFNKILQFSYEIRKSFNTKIQTSVLNKWLSEIIKVQPPIRIRGKEIKLKYMTQTRIQPPTFTIFSNYPSKLGLTYKRFLEKKLKLNFNYKNVPVFLKFLSSKNPFLKKK